MIGWEAIGERRDLLGESPQWLAPEGMLQHVDIRAGKVIRVHVPTGGETAHALGDEVGFALATAAGEMVAGVGRRVVRVDARGERRQVIAEVEPGRHDNRFNDAKADPHGRLWAGTMSRSRRRGTAALYRISGAGEVRRMIAGATISNGLDWNADATLLYYIDSTTQRVDAIAFDVDLGRLGARRSFVRIDPRDGLPDGLTVDADGGVWIALFGGGKLRRYTAAGCLDAELRLPVTNPTSLAFGGEALDTLYVTSARHRLSPPQLATEPLAGALLALRPGAHGRLPNRPRW
jgi:sugar lactone lactonase YvrE